MRRETRSTVAGLVVGFALTHAAPGPSQSPRVESSIRAAQARRALFEGREDEAVRLFRESLRLDPPPRVAREFALFLESRQRLRDAADAWRRYATLTPDPRERDTAITRAESLRATPSRILVRVVPARAARDARIWFDHSPPRTVPTGGAEVFVEAGAHRVRVESPGFAPFERTFATSFGEPLAVDVRLLSGEPLTGPEAAPDAGATRR